MQVLDYMQRATAAIRHLLAAAGVDAREQPLEPIVIVQPRTLQALMYASREHYQRNYIVSRDSDDLKRFSFGIKSGGVLFMTKEDYDAYSHHGRS